MTVRKCGPLHSVVVVVYFIKLTSTERISSCPDTIALTLSSFIPHQLISYYASVGGLGTDCASTHNHIAISWTNQLRTNINCSEIRYEGHHKVSDNKSLALITLTENTCWFSSTPCTILLTGALIITLRGVARVAGIGGNWTNGPTWNSYLAIGWCGKHRTLNDYCEKCSVNLRIHKSECSDSIAYIDRLVLLLTKPLQQCRFFGMIQ